MTEERLKMLTELGVDFDEPLDISVNVRDEDAGGDDADADKEPNRAFKWDKKFHELKQYKLTHGHTDVPRRSKRDPRKDALGEWVHFQRRQHRNLLTGKNSTMSIARKKALDCLEFQWTRGQGPSTTTRTGTIYCTDIKEADNVQIKHFGEKQKTESWNERFAQLEAYFRENGNVRVPSDYRENPHLPKWLKRQKKLYSIWKASLPEQHPPFNNVLLQPYEAKLEEDPRFDKQKYDKLVSLGFEFEKSDEVNEIMQDVSQGQDDVVRASSPTAPFATEEEEQPTLSYNDDVIEICVGSEDTPTGLLDKHLKGRHVAVEHPHIHQLHPEGQQLQQQAKGEYTNEHEHHIQSQNFQNEQQPANEQSTDIPPSSPAGRNGKKRGGGKKAFNKRNAEKVQVQIRRTEVFVLDFDPNPSENETMKSTPVSSSTSVLRSSSRRKSKPVSIYNESKKAKDILLSHGKEDDGLGDLEISKPYGDAASSDHASTFIAKTDTPAAIDPKR